MNLIFSSKQLPKLPPEVGPHPMDDLIYSLRHVTCEYINARATMDNNPFQIVCVNEALRALGRTFHSIAAEYKKRPNAQLAIAGAIFESGNRYFDLAIEE